MEQPNTLNDIFQANPGAFMQAQGMLGRQETAANQSIAGTQQEQDQNALMNPLRVQAQQNTVDQGLAQLPGMRAASDMQVRKNSNQALLNDSDIADQMGKYKTADRERHIKEIDDMGTTLQQLGSQAWDNPLGAAARSKAALEKAGHADMWNPQWDNLPPDQLAAAMNDAGVSIANTSQKMQLMHAQLNAKTDAAKALEEVKQAGREKLRSSMNTSAEAIAAAHDKAKLALDKPNMEQSAARMAALARQAEDAGDTETAAKYYARANTYLEETRAIKSAGAAKTGETKVDIGEMTKGQVPTVPAAPAPALGGVVLPAPAPAAKPAAPIAVPDGRIAVRNVKTGEIGHIPKDQIEKALAAGFEPVQ